MSLEGVKKNFNNYFHPEVLWKKGGIGKMKAIGAVLSWPTLVIPAIMAIGLKISEKRVAKEQLKNKINTNKNMAPENMPKPSLPSTPASRPVNLQPSQPVTENRSLPVNQQNTQKSAKHGHQIRNLLEPELIPLLEDVISRHNDPGLGYPPTIIEMLMLQHFNKPESWGICLGYDGKSSENFHKKIAYSLDFHLHPSPPYNVVFGLEALKKMLNNLIENPQHSIPSKVIIPLDLNTPGKVDHTVIAVIEPDPSNARKANITMVNFHGNGLSSNHEEEHIILNTIKQVYNDPQTKAIRNEKATFTGGYCGIDAVENVRLLTKVPDVHEFIKQGKLPSRSSQEIAKIRRSDAVELTDVLNNAKEGQKIYKIVNDKIVPR